MIYLILCAQGRYDIAIGTMVKTLNKTRDVARVDSVYEVKTTNPRFLRTLAFNQAEDAYLFLAGMGSSNESFSYGGKFFSAK